MKQTAVEWLNDEIIGLDVEFNMTLISRENYWIKRKELLEQAKEMEKQEMIKFAEYVAKYPDKNKNVNGEMLHAKSKYDGAERTVDLLEQYYNETFNKQ
jgi:hypothetical protein